MAIRPHTIDIVVADMGRALAFYRTLGLAAPEPAAGQELAEIITPGGAKLGFMLESMIREAMPHWVTPVGQRVTFACMCDSAEELDTIYARVIAAGYTGLREPWDAPWGQRYAFLQDPDGNRVDIFAAVTEAGEERG
jgi:uncharacterized glyoxalase superfamily protein PhnB